MKVRTIFTTVMMCVGMHTFAQVSGGTTMLANRLFKATPESFNAVDPAYPIVNSVVLSNGKVAFVYQNYQGGVSDVKLTLYDQEGSAEWTSTINHGLTDYGIKMAVDGSDNIFVLGASKTTEGDWDLFIEKHQSNGTLLYSTVYDHGDDFDEIPSDLYVESGGAVLVTGLCQSDDPSNGINDDAFVAKFSSTLSNQWFKVYDHAAYSDLSIGMEVAGGSIFLAVNSYSSATVSHRCIVQYDQSAGTYQNEVREASTAREYLTDIDVLGSSIVVTGRKKVGAKYVGVISSYAQSNLSQDWSTNFEGLGYGCKGMKTAVEGTYISWSCEAFDHKSEKLLFNHLVDDQGALLISNRIEDRALDGITEIRAVEKVGTNYAYLIERGSLSDGTTSYLLFYDKGMRSIKKFVLGSTFSPVSMSINGNKLSVAGYIPDPEGGTNVQGSCQLIETHEFDSGTEIDTTGGDSTEYVDNVLIIHFDPNVLNLTHLDRRGIEYGTFYEFADTSVGDDFEDTTGLDLDSLVLFKAYPRFQSSDTLDSNQYGRVFRLSDYYAIMKVKVPNNTDLNALMLAMQNITNGIRNYELIRIPKDAHSMEPNDGYWWDEWQFSLHGNTNSNRWESQFGNANIRILDAWKLSTGGPKVKVGVAEGGLAQYNHDDFTTIANSLDYSVIKGGVGSNTDLEETSVQDFSAHATLTAGVIGAIRNNQKGVAGIAGGTGTDLDGVSLYTFSGFQEIHGLDSSFRVHVMNNSWVGSAPSTTRLAGALDMYLAGIVRVSARNNSGNANISAPSTMFPDFSISVGALGKDGLYYKPSNTWSNNTSIYSGYGRGLDLMAPGAQSTSSSTHALEKKVTIDNREVSIVDFDETSKYFGHNQTSGAAPHVTGVVALLIDYKFDHVKNINTLFPEDIERLLELGTIDIKNDLDEYVNADHIEKGTPVDKRRSLPQDGYDELTGWGKLDATYVMQHIKAPYYDIIHLSEQDNFEEVTVSVSNSPIASDVITRMDYGYSPTNTHNFYKCDIYEVTITVDFSNIINDDYSDYSIFQLASYPEGGVWPLYSYTNLVARERMAGYRYQNPANYVSQKFPYIERTAMSKVNNTVTFKGYTYHLKEYARNSPTNFTSHNKWYPFNKTNAASKVTYGFSVHLVKDGVSIANESQLDFSVYPNPFEDVVQLELPKNPLGAQVRIVDVTGREMKVYQIAPEVLKQTLDLSDLPKGAYLLRLDNGQSSGNQTLIKH